jgi:hypothetical protein
MGRTCSSPPLSSAVVSALEVASKLCQLAPNPTLASGAERDTSSECVQGRWFVRVQAEGPAMQATFMLPRAAPAVAYSAAEGKVYGADYFLKAALAGEEG